uniref:Uncharacterized protein n=1 Tax=Rangifer tarandus platyrhynchus TaxID=3082113 RepID=A0ACB0F8P8_RANTA|nr:unnamed protein product [Rangifer tarandus platyrhynchus]
MDGPGAGPRRPHTCLGWWPPGALATEASLHSRPPGSPCSQAGGQAPCSSRLSVLVRNLGAEEPPDASWK